MSLIISGTETLTVTLDAAPAANQLQCTASWANQSGVAGDSGVLTTGVTAVALVAAPGAGVVRVVSGVTVYNADTAARGVTVAKGAFIVIRATIQPGCHLLYDNANGWKVVDATGAVVSASVQTSNAQPGDGLNLLVDGAFGSNLSGFSGGAIAAGSYGYDMWGGGTGGCNVTVNAATGIVTHTSGTVESVIEAPGIAGQALTVSINNPSGTVTVGLDGVTGTIPAGSGRRSVTLTAASGSTGNVKFTMAATGVTYSQIKVERGVVVTPWVNDLPGQLTTRVNRYWFKTFLASVAPAAATNSFIGALTYVIPPSGGGANYNGAALTFPQVMRAPPTLTFFNPKNAGANWYNLATLANSGPASTLGTGVSERYAYIINNPQVAGDAPPQTVAVHLVADARLPL